MAVDTTLKNEFQHLAWELVHEDFLTVAEDVTFVDVTLDLANFDVATGTYPVTESLLPLKAVVTTLLTRQRDDRPMTQKDIMVLIVPGVDLGAIVPVPDTDYVIRGGVKWALVDQTIDPATAAYMLHVRLP